ncbi:MAG: NfeD family protein [Candidatus Thermochlorobacter aerophilum]|jgi:membrane protein implicated in regulation of membrane protease activity|uniref:NfeD family protein n=1 Tax=Candidatus Thermochlorobacter aerophilus TaxID=1868324 RepID=A0A395M1G6_9BACT|nr:MAG: NfeD family protein [Candidatus Thermochlorobacter aerophilum]
MDNLGHWWSLAAVLLIIVEILSAGFVLGSFGVAAFITAIVAYIGFPIEFQLIVFIASSLVIFFTLRPIAIKYLAPKKKIETNVHRLIGKKAVVIETIDNFRQTGRVKIDGDDWRARTESQEVIPIGREVIIKAVDSATLIVASF